MQKAAVRLNKLLSIIAAVVMILMMLHVVIHALSRYFLNSPVYGTNEIVQFWYLPIIALVGIIAAQIQKEHITVTLVLERVRPGTAKVFRVFANIVAVLLSIGFAWYGLEEAISSMALQQTAGATSIITWPTRFLVPVVFAILAIVFIVEIIALFRAERPDQDPSLDSADSAQSNTSGMI